MHDADWNGKFVLAGEVEKALKETGLWNLNYSGAYQGLYHRRLWDILAHPEITHRVASLLGDDVICWRSQFFEKPLGSDGTFWHQAGTFRESSERPKLVPPVGMDPAFVQLTVWVALTHSTIANGCLRFLPGSFVDTRFEEFYYYAMEHLPDFLVKMSEQEIRDFLHVWWFSPGSFYRVRAIYDLALEHVSGLFEGGSVRDMEMKPGEFVIFTSANMHASYPNATDDDVRLGFAGRYTTCDVQVLPGFEYDVFPTPLGQLKWSLENTGSMLVHGADRHHWNKLVAAP